MLNKIKNLRNQTGAGVVDVKKALEEAQGDEGRALEILREKGKEKAAKKSDRVAGEGVVASYIHSNGKIGAMVKLYCETDFVARNSEFKALAQDIAMHITAMSPEDLPALLTQPFVKNPEQTISELLTEYISKIGENIQIGEFARFEL